MVKEQGGGRPHILVVDDEEAICTMFARFLEAADLKASTALNGREALSQLSENCFDLVITDLAMPELDGLRLIRAIRERDLDLPVLVVTAHGSEEVGREILEYGACGMLEKPILGARLIEEARRAIDLLRLVRVKRQIYSYLTNSSPWMGDRAAAETLFSRAIEQLAFAYQPIADAAEGRILGYEAFLRTGEKGVGGPMDFLAIAGKLGKTRELRSACDQVLTRAIENDIPPGLDVHVNLSAADLDDLNHQIEHTPLRAVAKRVVFEISDRLDYEAHDLGARISRLKAAGFRIGISNLGSGPMPLQLLAQIRPDLVKLDASIVRDLEIGDPRSAMVRDLVSACVALDQTLVAEGVETTAERGALLEVGCELQQGFLFGMPD